MRYIWVILVLPLMGFTFLDPVAKKNEEGNDLFKKGEYDAALQQYLEAQQNAPDRSELRFNAGDALYKQGKYDEAAQELGQVVDVADQNLSASAYYNLGNTLFRQEKFEEAAGAYKQSLLKNPQDQDAKVNLELALEKLQQQQEQKDDQQKQDEKNDNQDQNKKKQDQEQKDDQQQDQQDDENKQDKQDGEQEQKESQDEQNQDKQEQKNEQQNQQQNQEQNQNPGQQDAQQAEAKPGELTPEEAARILDAMKDREDTSQKRRKIRVSGRRYNGNAW